MYRTIEAPPNFIELCIRDEVLPEEIDDFVQRWHQSDSNRELYEFLGMTWDEYATWVADASILPLIVASHKTNRPLLDLIQDTASSATPVRSRNPEKDSGVTKKLLEITAEIVQTQAASTSMTSTEIASSLQMVFHTLREMQKVEAERTIRAPQMLPEEAEIPDEAIKTPGHGMSRREYKKKYGFTMRTPLATRSLTKAPGKPAKKRGLPQNLIKYIEARRQKKTQASAKTSAQGVEGAGKPKPTRILKR